MGNNLKQIRNQKGLTTYELAKKVGVSRSCISMIEDGHRNPRLKTAGKIAITLGASIEEIFFDNKSCKTLQNEKGGKK